MRDLRARPNLAGVDFLGSSHDWFFLSVSGGVKQTGENAADNQDANDLRAQFGAFVLAHRVE
jgi:hypothetical protein